MQVYFQWPRVDLTFAMIFAAIAAVYFGVTVCYAAWDLSLGREPAPNVNAHDFWLVRYYLRRRVVISLTFCGAFSFLGLIALVLYVFNNQGGENAAFLLCGAPSFMRRVYKYAVC